MTVRKIKSTAKRVIAIKRLIILIAFCFISAQAQVTDEAFNEFFAKMLTDFEGLVLEELPKIGTYDASKEQKCLDRLASSKVVNAEVLVHRVVNMTPIKQSVRTDKQTNPFIYFIYEKAYGGLLSANKAENSEVTFFFTRDEGAGHLDYRLFCFAKEIK